VRAPDAGPKRRPVKARRGGKRVAGYAAPLNAELADRLERFRGRGIDDPDLQIDVRLGLWEDMHNPAYLWQAIGICIKYGRVLPPAVMDYLADVAARMSSPEARAAKDLHKVLPSILGFPAKGPGPGRLLDPDAAAGDRDDRKLAMLFAVELEQRLSPVKHLLGFPAHQRG